MTHRRNHMTAFLLTLMLVVPTAAERPAKATKPAKSAPIPGMRAARTVMVPMRDGVKLATEVILPDKTGRWPTLLVRTPYSRRDKGAWKLLARVSAGYDCAIVTQALRGRDGSEGEDYPVFQACGWGKQQDGYDTIEWIAKQPWSNGKVGQCGASGPAISANMTAPSRPPHLACQLVFSACSDFYKQAMTWNGTLRRRMTNGWFMATRLDVRHLGMLKHHPTYDVFWKDFSPESVADRVNVPVCVIGGWYDIFTQGSINTFVTIHKKGDKGARGKCRLVMGPWAHGPFTDLKYPRDAGLKLIEQEMAKWFGRWLNGAESQPREPPVRYFAMGACGESGAPGNVWRDAETWPLPSKEVRYYLHKGGLLSRNMPKESSASAEYEYDPKNPVPTCGGGNLLIKKGPADQREVEKRNDVLVFTTPVLSEPVEATGRVKVKLWASSDCVDTDFTAKLTDVYPDGRSMLVLDGVVSARFRESFTEAKPMTPGKVYAFDIDLWSTSIIFNKGHRIRVSISSSNSPRFAANPNTGKPFANGDKTRVARNTIFLDRDRPSHIVLPRPIPAGGN